MKTPEDDDIIIEASFLQRGEARSKQMVLLVGIQHARPASHFDE